ncbi:MAG: TolC family protein [Saprospiraceae bacterium]
MKDIRLLFGLLLLLFVGQLQAQDQPKPLTLQESVQYGIQNSPQVQTAALNVQKNEWLVKQVLSSGLPQVDINGQFTYNYEIPVFLVPGAFAGQPEQEVVGARFGTNLNTTFTGQVSQLLFSRTFFLGLDAAKKSRQLYELQTESTKDQLTYQIAQLYYSIQVTQKQRNVLQANLDQVKTLLSLTQKQFNNGLAKKIDVDQLQVNRINLENQLKNLDLQVEQLKQTLKFNMAMPLDQPIVLTDTINESAYTIPDLGLFTPDFTQKKDLAILDVQAQLNELNVDQYRAGYWPTISAFGNINYQAAGNQFSDLQWFRFGGVGLNLSVPIFDGFQKKAQIQQAKIEQAQLAENRRLTTQSLALAYNQAIQEFQTNINNLQALAENRRVAEEVYRVSQSRFTEGVAPITEVLTAETSMREAQTNYLSALLQVKLAEIAIRNAQGTLTNSILNNN